VQRQTVTSRKTWVFSYLLTSCYKRRGFGARVTVKSYISTIVSMRKLLKRKHLYNFITFVRAGTSPIQSLSSSANIFPYDCVWFCLYAPTSSPRSMLSSPATLKQQPQGIPPSLHSLLTYIWNFNYPVYYFIRDHKLGDKRITKIRSTLTNSHWHANVPTAPVNHTSWRLYSVITTSLDLPPRLLWMSHPA